MIQFLIRGPKHVNVVWGVTRWYQTEVATLDLKVNADCYA